MPSAAIGRRLTVEFSPHDTKELDRLRRLTGQSISALMRHGLYLLKIYADNDGKIFIESDGEKIRLLLPLTIYHDSP